MDGTEASWGSLAFIIATLLKLHYDTRTIKTQIAALDKRLDTLEARHPAS